MLLTLALIIGTPFLVAGAALLVGRRSTEWAGVLALVAPTTVIVLGIPIWREVGGGGAEILVPVEWFPTLGITANLLVTRLGAFFVLLIGIVGLGIVQFSRYYLGEKATGGFWAMLLAFMGSMLGIVLSDSLLLLFIFWEATTITSALLIGMDFSKEESRHGALQAFLVTGIGGLAMLAGIVLLGQLTGTYSLSELRGMGPEIVATPGYVAPMLLILLGAFTKSAQFPFHFWLPGAMAAPAPISSYLHSATMVKAGVFLIGQLFPVFHTAPLWFPLLATVGLTTFFVAGWSAIRAYDLKQLLAYSTVAYLGVLTALYGYASLTGHLRGELLHIANHALYKSSLFLLLGWVEKAMGTRDLRILQAERWWDGGSAQRLAGRIAVRTAAVLIGIGAFAMAGLPFLLGFMSKEVLLEILIGETFTGVTLGLAVFVVSSALAFAYAAKLFINPFWGPKTPPLDRGLPPGEVSFWLLIVPAILLVPQVVGGVVPGWYLGSVLEPGTQWPEGFAFWHYIDAALAASLSMFTLGVVLFLAWRRIAALPHVPGPQHVSNGIATGAVTFATGLSRTIQSGGHPRFIAIILAAALVAMGLALAWQDALPETVALPWGPDIGLGWLPAIGVAAAALLAVALRDRISKVVMMAVVGYGLAVFYVLYRAPDLALTQLLVETVSVILLLLIFRRMPALGDDPRPRGQRLVHGAVAAVLGLGIAALAWAAGVHQPPARAGAEHLARALPEAEGRNVVNVILVDFRGLDTLGEIVVLVIAAIGALALFRAGGREREAERGPVAAREPRSERVGSLVGDGRGSAGPPARPATDTEIEVPGSPGGGPPSSPAEPSGPADGEGGGPP